MRISDWSSDVCSSDLCKVDVLERRASDLFDVGFFFGRFLATLLRLCPKRQREVDRIEQTGGLQIGQTRQIAAALQSEMGQKALGGRIKDRKSVVSGKSVSVRVDLGGRRFIKKKQYKNNN